MAGGIQNITSTAGKSARQDSFHASLTNQSIGGQRVSRYRPFITPLTFACRG